MIIIFTREKSKMSLYPIILSSDTFLWGHETSKRKKDSLLQKKKKSKYNHNIVGIQSRSRPDIIPKKKKGKDTDFNIAHIGLNKPRLYTPALNDQYTVTKDTS